MWQITLIVTTLFLSHTLGDILNPQVNPDCPRPLFWNGIGTTSWTNPANWEDYEDQASTHIPEDFNQVFMVQGASEINNDQVTISLLKIDSKSKLTIGSTASVTIFNTELVCWGVNWCSNHGKCVAIDTCECDPGYSGANCSIKQCEEGSVMNACGICDNEIGGDLDTCHCSNYLGRSPSELDRILLIDTNEGLIEDIGIVINTINTLQDLLSQYDPNSRLLENEIMSWILYIQDFLKGNLAGFTQENNNFLQNVINGLKASGRSSKKQLTTSSSSQPLQLSTPLNSFKSKR